MREGRCDRCKRYAWINGATDLGAFIGEYCAACFEVVPHDPPETHPHQTDSGPNHNDPGFDNLIRALEEDR
jgi:hypothetical protein